MGWEGVKYILVEAWVVEEDGVGPGGGIVDVVGVDVETSREDPLLEKVSQVGSTPEPDGVRSQLRDAHIRSWPISLKQAVG